MISGVLHPDTSLLVFSYLENVNMQPRASQPSGVEWLQELKLFLEIIRVSQVKNT